MGILQGVYIVSLLITLANPNLDNKINKGYVSKLTNRNHMHEILSEMIEGQINVEMEASLVYTVMASHFANENVNRQGFKKLFQEAASENREDALKFIEYLNKRGGGAIKLDITMPKYYNWTSGLAALKLAVMVENQVTHFLMLIHSNSTETFIDPHLSHFLESEFLGKQIDNLRKIQGFYNNLEAMTDPKDKQQNNLAEYEFDLQLQKSTS